MFPFTAHVFALIHMYTLHCMNWYALHCTHWYTLFSPGERMAIHRRERVIGLLEVKVHGAKYEAKYEGASAQPVTLTQVWYGGPP